MGFRLGSRIIKIWRWIKRCRKTRSYARLHYENRRKTLRLRMGSKRSFNSQSLPHCSKSCNSPSESSVSLLQSPQYSDQKPRGRHFHFPHLELMKTLNFHQWHFPVHLHLPHISRGYNKGLQVYDNNSSKHGVPKGCLAVEVGEEEEHHQRYVIPVVYFNHPLFGKLLKETEKEFGFEQEGIINIPCRVSHFENVQRIIHTERCRNHNH